MNAEIKAGIHNRFDIEVIDARTGEVRKKAKAFNVICETLWTHLLSSSASTYFNYIIYGSGSGTPSSTDTALFVREGAKATGGITFAYDDDTLTASFMCPAVLGVSDAVGVTLSEVGIGYDNTHIVTHAMLQDMNGNPITIEKTDTDIINIYATIFVHKKESYSGMNLDISYARSLTSGYYTGLTSWLAGIRDNNYGTFCNRVLASRNPLLSYRSGTLPGDISVIECNTALDADNKSIASTVRFGVDFANLNGGIKHLGLYTATRAGNYGAVDVQPVVIIPVGIATGFLGYPITADSIGTGDGTETEFQTHFDVHSDFVLKVNGVSVSNYTRDGRNITFATAPEVGAVVTADYFTDTIPKDANHVYDLTVTLSLGEYTPD